VQIWRAPRGWLGASASQTGLPERHRLTSSIWTSDHYLPRPKMELPIKGDGRTGSVAARETGVLWRYFQSQRFSTTYKRLMVALRAASFSQGLQANTVAHAAGQRALRAAFVGFFVDMFDMYLPIVVLAPAMSYFQPAIDTFDSRYQGS
jgi:hypothetical protein